MTGAVEGERERVLGLIQRHGWNATAFQTLEGGYRYFFHGDVAAVAYVDTGPAWVAAGAPIAATEHLQSAAVAFVRAARARGKRSCFFAVEARLLEAAASELSALEVGAQPSWDPRRWPSTLAGRRSLREQLRRARAKGVSVRPASAEELESGPLRDAMSAVISRWLATRGLAPMAFLVQIEPFAFAAERRWFVAERDGRAIAFAGLVPVPARSGWFVEDVLREPDAPNGTSELLVDAALRWAASNGATWLTLGLVPLAGDVARPLRLVGRYTRALYDFGGLERYKRKLCPDAWTPIYVAFPPEQSAALAIVDSLAAFAGGGLVRFALRSLWRGPPFVLRLLAALLVPWTLLLASPLAARWLEPPITQWLWVAFDIALVGALLQLARHPSRRLATALALAISADALLTALQGGVWLATHPPTPTDLVVVLVAIAAPALAARVLWGTRSRVAAFSHAPP